MRKKLFSVMSIAGMIVLSICNLGNTTAQADSVDVGDQCFIEFISSETDDIFTYNSKLLYNENLEENGRLYSFMVGEQEGYALLSKIEFQKEVIYEVEEFFYTAVSPFDSCKGIPVYVTYGTYMEYYDGDFYDLITGNKISKSTVEEKGRKGFSYSGGDYFTDKQQTINYASKIPEEYSIKYDLPNYSGKAGQSNCANTAGGVILGYYDRFFENLIPNYQSYVRIGAVIRYKSASTNVDNMLDELYVLMDTDQGQLGTTYTGFQEGMKAYVENRGYTYSTTSLFSNGMFDFTKYKQAVKNNKPVAVFLQNFAMLNRIQENSTQDIISSGYCALSHVAVGCGYKQDRYYNAAGNLLDTRTSLKVASALEEYNIGYLNINGLSTINRALSVTIQ